MIDLHTHCLPGVDDGARSVEESLKLLEALKKASFHTVFLTPHVSSKRMLLGQKETIETAFHALKQAVKDAKLDLELYLGSEFDAHSKTHRELEEGFTLHQSPYVLLDLTYAEHSYEEVLYTLSVLGYKVILAHVERYGFLSLKELAALKQVKGIYCQLNVLSLLKKAPSKHHKRAKQCLKAGLIDVIGTDTHRFYPQYETDLIEALSLCRKKTDAKTFERLTEGFVREAILNG